MLEASINKVNWAKWEYFDILWDMDTPDTDAKMMEFARPLAASGQREMELRVGRAYRFGRGVERDLAAAAEWMEKSASKNLAQARSEYAEVLQEIEKFKTMSFPLRRC